MTKTMTTPITERCTGRTIRIEGDIVAAMRACVARNERLANSGMGGEWRIGFDFNLSPSEYAEALVHFPKATTPERVVAPVTYQEYRTARLSNGSVVRVGSSDPTRHSWAGPDGETLCVGHNSGSGVRIVDFV